MSRLCKEYSGKICTKLIQNNICADAKGRVKCRAKRNEKPGVITEEQYRAILIEMGLLDKKEVKIANDVNNVKFGARCLEGLGRPVRPNRKSMDSFAELYLEAYEREKVNPYGCTGYMMYDFENSQYCCSSRKRTPSEMIDFLFMMLETLSKTVKKGNLRMIEYYFDKFIKMVPLSEQDVLRSRFGEYMRDIQQQHIEFNTAANAPLAEEDERFMQKFEQNQNARENNLNAINAERARFLKSQHQTN